jgi:hypothetical protein
MAFTIGMRLFFLFIVLIVWTGGVTWMLIASVLITFFLAYFDMCALGGFCCCFLAGPGGALAFRQRGALRALLNTLQ